MKKIDNQIFKNVSLIFISSLLVYTLSLFLLTFTINIHFAAASLFSLTVTFLSGSILFKIKILPYWQEVTKENTSLRELIRSLNDDPDQAFDEKPIDQHIKELKDSFSQTSKEINALTDKNCKLESKLEELKSNREVEDLKIQILDEQKKIAQLGKKLEEADKIKSEFLSNISHELRTPMNGIIGMTELLMDTSLDDEQNKFLEIVKNSGYNLLSLINNVLDFSYIESGNLEIEEIDFNIKSTLKNLISITTIKAEDKGLSFKYSISSDVPDFIHSDPGRIRQLLNNILSNAVKFTETGSVEMRCNLLEGDERNSLSFVIKDTGIGIPKSFVPHLYEKFSQADGSYTRTYGGTGIGLSLTHELVNLMNGTIDFTTKEGVGTEFIITIPFTQTPKESQEIDHIDIENLKILLLDDNLSNLNIYEKIFRSLHLDFELFSSGFDAIQSLKESQSKGTPYDIAFLDMQMPDMSGLEIGDIIKGNQEYGNTSLVLLSSIAKKGDAKLSHEVGFDAFLSKPINKLDIVDCLKLIQAHKVKDIQERKELITVHSIRENRIGTRRILLVEDNRTNIIIASGILESLGYKYNTANDGLEALERLKDETYDLIFMDLEMPKLNGIDTTKIIREDKSKEFSNIPIIAMTANSNPEVIKKCKKAGMNDSVVKPISSTYMVRILQKWLD